MKTIQSLTSFLLIAVLTGCGTMTVKPGSDPVVVYAEQTADTALNLFDAFLKWERSNEATLLKVSPQIHATADEIRTSGLTWIKELRTATKIYKENKSEKNKALLESAKAILEFALTEVKARLAEGGKSL